MKTEIAPIERAHSVLAYAETKARLAELAAKSQRIVEITGAPGYQEAHRARMDLKNTRVEVQRRGKEAREDATAYSKAVIAAEKELIGVIEPEESRLQRLQDAWDAAREAERQAKIRAEQDRVSAIQLRIAAIRALPAVAGRGSSQIEESLAIAEVEIGDGFEEFIESAKAAQTEAINTLRGMIEAAKAIEEAERAKIAADHARAESLRIEAEKLAADRAELDRQQAALRAQQEAAAKAQADAEAAQRAAQESLRKTEEDARRAELERQREAERVAREAAEAQAEAARKQAAEAYDARIAAEISSATLREAAEEAVVLLTEVGEGEHIITRKLAAALSRDGAA